MANRRMFSKEIVLDDNFLEMKHSAQVLYYTFGMMADDDGFLSNYRSAMKLCDCSREDLEELIRRGYIYLLDPPGIAVIKHWKLNNYLQGDRYKETKWVDIKNKAIREEHRVYQLIEPGGECCSDTECIQDVSDMEAQTRIEKNSLDKGSGGEGPPPPPDRYKSYGIHKNVRLTEEEYKDIKAHVRNPEERINKFSTGIKLGWKNYDPDGTDHYDRIISFAAQDGMLFQQADEAAPEKPRLTISGNDYKAIVEEAKAKGADRGSVIDAMEFYGISRDDSRPTSEGVRQKILSFVESQILPN
jgi:hypothetical protein